MWDAVLARFEKWAPASVRARLALERAMPAAWTDDLASVLAQRLLKLVRYIKPSRVATSKRGPKVKKTREWVDGAMARAHVSTDRLVKASKSK